MRLQGQQGYAMAVLLVGMSIAAIMMTVAMPTWRQLNQREKEAELVFRGEQYARAIGLFQRKNGPGTLPANLDVLIDQRFLRRKYKDPITNDDFLSLTQAQTAQPNQPGQPAAPQTGRGRGAQAAAPAIGGAQRGGQAQQQPGAGAVAGGVRGVASKSKESSIRLYKGRSHYNEWEFIFTPPVNQAGQGGQGAPGVGGQPQRGGRGGDGRGTNPQTPNPFGGRQGPPDGRGFGSPNGPNGPGRGGQPINPFPQPTRPGR